MGMLSISQYLRELPSTTVGMLLCMGGEMSFVGRFGFGYFFAAFVRFVQLWRRRQLQELKHGRLATLAITGQCCRCRKTCGGGNRRLPVEPSDMEILACSPCWVRVVCAFLVHGNPCNYTSGTRPIILAIIDCSQPQGSPATIPRYAPCLKLAFRVENMVV